MVHSVFMTSLNGTARYTCPSLKMRPLFSTSPQGLGQSRNLQLMDGSAAVRVYVAKALATYATPSGDDESFSGGFTGLSPYGGTDMN